MKRIVDVEIKLRVGINESGKTNLNRPGNTHSQGTIDIWRKISWRMDSRVWEIKDPKITCSELLKFSVRYAK